AATVARPPRAPPFPYTTLSRSVGVRRQPGQAATTHEVAAHPVVGDPLAHAGVLPPLGELGGHAPCLRGVPRPPVPLGHHGVAMEDRKSTRLNSSHVKTSYAVFC